MADASKFKTKKALRGGLGVPPGPDRIGCA